jgi:hypothetical protein
MTRSKPLRVVAADESAPKPKSLLEAVESGDYLAELRAAHRRIASAVSDPNTPARDLASLTRRQLEFSREIRAIVSAAEGDEVGTAADTPDEEWVAN